MPVQQLHREFVLRLQPCCQHARCRVLVQSWRSSCSPSTVTLVRIFMQGRFFRQCDCCSTAMLQMADCAGAACVAQTVC